MWTLKKSDQLSPYSFSCLRAKSAADGNDGKRGGEKERDRTAKYSCRSAKEDPPRFTFLWCWGGAGNSPVQYKFQSMHPGGRTCVNSLFPAFNIFQSTHPGGCNCVNSLFPVFDIHIKRICLQVVSTPQTTLFIAAVCSKVRRDSFLHSNIVDRKYISLTFFESGGQIFMSQK